MKTNTRRISTRTIVVIGLVLGLLALFRVAFKWPSHVGVENAAIAQQAPPDLSVTLGLVPVGDRPVDPQDTAALDDISVAATAAAASVTPGPNSGAQRRLIAGEVETELEAFASNHTSSAWTPSIRLRLARTAQYRSGYSKAIEHYLQLWVDVGTSTDLTAQSLLRRSSGPLAKLLALTGQLDLLGNLEQAVVSMDGGAVGIDWKWARQTRAWVQTHPTEAYKCGLYCLDQLGRRTRSLPRLTAVDVTVPPRLTITTVHASQTIATAVRRAVAAVAAVAAVEEAVAAVVAVEEAGVDTTGTQTPTLCARAAECRRTMSRRASSILGSPTSPWSTTRPMGLTCQCA